MDFLRSQLMEKIKMTAFVNLFGVAKMPLLAFLMPQFEELSEEKCVIKVRKGYRTRNHLNSMYFGALAMGSELSVAAVAVWAIRESGKKIDFIFKDFEAQFLKRADNHVLFICKEVRGVKALIARASESSERLEGTFEGYARTVASDEPIMKYKLTISVRNRSNKKDA